MPKVTYRLRGTPWLYGGQQSWVFVTLPRRQGAEVRAIFAGLARGASLPCTVTVGATTWRTSIFADTKSGSYVLPLKAAVRKAEGLEPGRPMSYRLEVDA